MKTITLEQLIEEGKNIRKTITYIDAPSGVTRIRSAHCLADNSGYETWKYISKIGMTTRDNLDARMKEKGL